MWPAAGGPSLQRMGMNIVVRNVGKVSVVDVSGWFVFGSDAALSRAVMHLVEGGHRSVLVNLREIERIDSAGIGTLIHCKKIVEAAAGTIAIVRPKSPVALRPLWETLMLEYFDNYDDELNAVGSL